MDTEEYILAGIVVGLIIYVLTQRTDQIKRLLPIKKTFAFATTKGAC